MEKTRGRTLQPIYEWLKNPTSWVSLVAFGFSLFSFYYVYYYTGTIKVLLPPEIMIGLGGQTGKFTIDIPTTFTNTGSPHTRQHIQYITGSVHSLDKTVALEGPLTWTRERKFVGSDEYLHRYPEKRNEGYEDYLDYAGRAWPFSLSGAESVMKVIELEMAMDFSGPPPSKLEVELILSTVDGRSFQYKKLYKCLMELNLQRGTATYCEAIVNEK